MADGPEDFGEKTASAADAAYWVALIKTARAATVGYHFHRDKPDRMRPEWGSGHASSESGEG